MFFFFLKGLEKVTARYISAHGMVLSKGQVAKGQLSKMMKHSYAAHVFRSSFKKEFTCNGLKSVSKTLRRQIEWVRSRSDHRRSSVKHE